MGVRKKHSNATTALVYHDPVSVTGAGSVQTAVTRHDVTITFPVTQKVSDVRAASVFHSTLFATLSPTASTAVTSTIRFVNTVSQFPAIDLSVFDSCLSPQRKHVQRERSNAETSVAGPRRSCAAESTVVETTVTRTGVRSASARSRCSDAFISERPSVTWVDVRQKKSSTFGYHFRLPLFPGSFSHIVTIDNLFAIQDSFHPDPSIFM